MYEIGRPGAWVNRRKWKSRAFGTLHAVVAIALGLSAAVALLGIFTVDSAPGRATLSLAGLSAAAVCVLAWRRASHSFTRAAQAAAGVRSERMVRDALRRTDAVAAAYGLMLGRKGGDCDVVVFTRHGGAVVIEVKSGTGAVGVEGDGLRAGRRRLKSSPLRQAADQSRRLATRLGRKAVLGVVCLPGMTNRPFRAAGGIWVCSARDLPLVLDHAPCVVRSSDEAKDLLNRLWQTSAAK